MGFSFKNIFSKDNVSSAAGVTATAATGDPLVGSVTKNAVSQGFDWLGLGQSFLPAVGAGLSYLQQNAMLDKIFSFQERMSSTAHQREVADLLAAGINPLYTATGGSGASTPTGVLGSQTDFSNAFSSGVGSAMARRIQKAQIEAMDFENAARAQNVENGIKQNELLQKQIDNYERELSARLELMKSQGIAAIASGAAASASASYTQQQEVNSVYTNNQDKLYSEWLDSHPFARWRYLNGRAGLGVSLSGSGSSTSGRSGSSFGFSAR